VISPHRVRQLNQQPIREGAAYVLYWAQMNRRVNSNHALHFAVDLANRLSLPVLYYEGLTCSYPYANDRLHTFILEGVPDTARQLERLGIGYAFYLRKRHSDPNDILYRLARSAAAVVTDDYPTFIAARHNARVPQRIGVAYYAVDASCVVPMNLIGKREHAAYTIRPKIQKLLPTHLKPLPALKVRHRYQAQPPGFHTVVTPGNISTLTAACEIDHGVPPSITFRGGSAAAKRHLSHFLENNLRRYAKEKNEPAAHATSKLSPYLHFGHISSLDVALQVQEAARENGWMAESFLEELIVRRELAFNFARWGGETDTFASIPDWARESLRAHAKDPQTHVYTTEQFERAATADPLWNATQKELLLRGKIHGYYRMYWGKKMVEWSASYEEALDAMIRLHDRYALDGRDPCTYTNILWCFGLHDRPWPERPVFGKLRSMTFEGMKRKTNVAAYLREIDHIETTGADPFRLK
jgi:deoxyribodipyrimidine photo-lyase